MTTTIPLSFEARNSLPASNELTPATHYLVLEADGTRTLYLSDADAPYTLRRVMGGLMAASALSRQGVLTSRLTRTATTLGHVITNPGSSPLVITSVTVERVTLSGGTATINARTTTNGAPLAIVQATAQNGGLMGALHYTLAPGASVALDLQATGGTLTAQLSSGHTWPGLTVGANLITAYDPNTGSRTEENNGAPAAQLALQFGASSTPVRALGALSPLTATVVDGQWLVGLASGAETVTPSAAAGSSLSSGAAYGVYVDVTPTSSGYLIGLDDVPAGGGGTQVPELWDTATQTLIATGPPIVSGRALFDAPAPYTLGITYRLGVRPTSPGGASLSTYEATTTGWSGWTALGNGLSMFTQGIGSTAYPNQPAGRTATWSIISRAGTGLAIKDIALLEGKLNGYETRLTALEARPTWTREQIEDQVASMFPGATYADNGDGTGTITLPPGVTREQVEDWSAALLAAGSNVTLAYTDNGENPGTVTISATGSTTGNSAGGVFRGSWAANTAYNVGDVVIQGGAAYYAKAAFTSGASFSAANWNAWPDQVGSSSGGGSGITVVSVLPTSPTVGQVVHLIGSGYRACVAAPSPIKWESATGQDVTPPGTNNVPFAKYRLAFSASNNANYVITQEVILREVAGGATICTGGSASASSSLFSTNSGNAFDGDLGGAAWAGPASSSWLRYDLPAAKKVVEYSIYPRDAGYEPKAWVLQGSQDGTTWADLHTVADAGAWTSGTPKTYSVG